MDCGNGWTFKENSDFWQFWYGLRGPAGPAGPPGRSVELRGPVASVSDLPATAPASELWQVGTQAPYNGYFFNGAAWVNLGPVAAGATFTPTVSSDGVISWTNDGGLPNPESVNIKGPQGATGPQGPQGATGPAGPGVPAGGSAGKVLKKQSATDYDTAWVNDIAVTGSTIQATETTKDSLPEAIKAVLDSVNPQNWAAGIYRGKFIRSGGGVKTSFTGDYHMMVSSPGGNYASQGIVAAQGSIFNIWYANAAWVVTKQAPADLGITGASVGDLVRISAVSDGKPTAFEKISDPNGNIGIVQNTNTATQNITAGQYVIWKGTLYKASSAIASGATLSGSNLTAVTGGGLNAIKDLFSAVTIHTSNAVAGTDVVLTSGFSVRSIGNLVLVHIIIRTTNTIPAYQTLISGLPDHAPTYGFALAGSNGVAYRGEAIGSAIACPDGVPSGIYLNGFLAYTHGSA